jgi:hypothetical protein
MPENIGFPISETGGREYFMLEMHLDNPGGLPGITFDTGTVIHYTPNLRFSLDLKNMNIEYKYYNSPKASVCQIFRPVEAAVLLFGYSSKWKTIIPPNSKNFTVTSHCSPSCTSKIGAEGYTIFNVQLHAHNSAKKMRIRHFRNGTELPWISSDYNYNNKFQSNRNIQPVKLLPNDHLTIG